MKVFQISLLNSVKLISMGNKGKIILTSQSLLNILITYSLVSLQFIDISLTTRVYSKLYNTSSNQYVIEIDETSKYLLFMLILHSSLFKKLPFNGRQQKKHVEFKPTDRYLPCVSADHRLQDVTKLEATLKLIDRYFKEIRVNQIWQVG